jgi:hypothetical protein
MKPSRHRTRNRDRHTQQASGGAKDLHEDDRDCFSHTLDRGQRECALGQDHIRLHGGEFRRVAAYVIEISGAPTYIDSQAGSVLPAKLLQPVQECRYVAPPLPIIVGETHQDTNSPKADCLLRPRVERPSGNRFAEKGDEVAPLHVLMPRLWRGLSGRFAAHSAYHGADDRSLGHI